VVYTKETKKTKNCVLRPFRGGQPIKPLTIRDAVCSLAP